MKIRFFLIFFFTSLFGSEYLNIGVGSWYLNWEQNDNVTDSKIIQDKQIEHKFKIKDSFAKEINIKGTYGNVKTSFSYILSEDNNNEIEKYFGKIDFSFEHMDTYFKYTYTETSGVAIGIDNSTKNDSFISFNTELKSFDVIIYPKKLKYIGFGYRNMSYTLPQTIYILNKNVITYQGIEKQMEWKADFLTLSFDSSRKLKKNSFYFNLLGGISFDVKVEGDTIKEAGVSNYLKGDKGYFYQGEVGYLFKIEKNNSKFNTKIGYRYNYQTLETKSNSDIYIYAKNESKFYGPFISLNFLF